MTATVRLEAVVHGRVQGVGFRMYVRDVARRRGLVGWVARSTAWRSELRTTCNS